MASFIIYTTSAFVCPYCIKAKQTLDSLGHEYDERDISNPDILAELKEKRPSARTVPQIFLRGGAYIGGSDDLDIMAVEGSLERLISYMEE